MKRTTLLPASAALMFLVFGCGETDTGMDADPILPFGGQGGGGGAAGIGNAGFGGAGGAGGTTGGAGGMTMAGMGGLGGAGGMVVGGMSGGTGGMGGTGGATGGMGGMGGMSGGMGGMGGDGGMGGTPGGRAPTIPALTADCPTFGNDTITFESLSGIQMVAGTKAAGPTAPMVFYWHGTGSRAGEYAGWTDIVSGVTGEGGVLVSFDGTTGGDLLSGTSIFGRSDLELVDQLVACAVANHNVDPRRIFTTGCSAGGLFATAMAMLRSSYVAAAAPNSGGLTFAGAAQFENDYTPALMTMHGGSGDNVFGLDFGMSSATADNAFKMHGGFVINCDHGGSHCGARALAGNVWDFFKAHPYGVEPAPSPWTSGLPAGFSSDCVAF
jgi:predicted esterase